MTTQERAELFLRSMDAANKRVPVLLCSASSDLRLVRELTELASDLGGIPMITPPFVSEITDGQIAQFFADITHHSRTGIVIYNAPGIGITLSAPLMEKTGRSGRDRDQAGRPDAVRDRCPCGQAARASPPFLRVQTTKAAMNAQGFKGGSVRPPLRDLEGAALEEIDQALKEIAANPVVKASARAA
jgi:dihydrodipicolinate synthase/N-acetylneuraminate lyase